MKVREHRGSLSASLATTVEIDSTMDALHEHIKKTWAPFNRNVALIKVTSQGFDHRIGWDSHIIEVTGYGVFGYCDYSPDMI